MVAQRHQQTVGVERTSGGAVVDVAAQQRRLSSAQRPQQRVSGADVPLLDGCHVHVGRRVATDHLQRLVA